MRHRLLAAVAAAPLITALAGVALGSGGRACAATTTVSSSTSTPLATSTAASGQPSDIDVASGGSISPTTATPAITLDSDNKVTIEGTISTNNVANSVGVLVLGGHTGSLTTTGPITITEDFAASDTVNSDGIAEAPFAQGVGRYGVRSTGTAAFTGDITLGGAVSVKGQNSYGVSLEAPLNGSLTVTGGVTLTGDNGVAVQETGGVTGGVTLNSAISAAGQASRAVLIGGDVGGALRLGGALSATGYASTTRQADAAQAKIQATPTDVEQAGSAVTVAGSLGGGLYLSAPPANTVSGSTADLDADGVADGSELTGSIAQYGSPPALLVGASDKTISLGAFGAGANGYGILLRGNVTAVGLEDFAPATAIQLGTGDGQVNVAGGVRIVGAVSATAYEADATGLHLLAGASVPTLDVEGTLSGVITHSTLVTTGTAATAHALTIDAGATLRSIVNTGAIAATATGDATGAIAVRDASGSVSSVLNEGTIAATATAYTAGQTATGLRVALDLSQNTTGVTLVQQTNPSPNQTYGSTSGTADVGTTTVTAVTPAINGDVYLGSGRNTVDLEAGTLTGALSLGSGAGSSLTINGGATLAGAVTQGAGGTLALNVANGVLDDASPTTLNLTSLNIGATGKVYLTVDGAAGRATQLVSSGPATIAAGAEIGVRLSTAPAVSQSYVVVSSPQLGFGGDPASLTATTSYLYASTFAVNAAAGTITLDLSRKSQAELGLTNSEYDSVNGVLAGTAANPNLLRATLLPTDKASFIKTYDQLLPDHSGGIFLAAQSAADSIGRAAIDPRSMDAGPGGWVQQFAIGIEQNRGEAVASHVGGFGFAGGVETGDSGLGQFGVTAAFANATSKNPDIDTDSQASFTELEGGVYWRADVGGLKLSARAGGGYLWGYDRRYVTLAATDTTTAVATANKGTWHGYTLDGRATAAYQFDLGRWFVRPQVSGEYFRLNQDGYTEKGGGDGVDLVVDSRTGDEASGTASVVLGAKFGRNLVWRPSLEIGARDVFSGDAGSTTARFVSGGDSFTLVPNSVTGVGGLVRAGLKVGGSAYEFYVDAQGQVYDKYRDGEVRGGVRILF